MSPQPADPLVAVTVRPLTAQDIAAVAEVERTTPGAPHWGLSDYQDCLLPHQATLHRWAWVAERAGCILGFAVVRGVSHDQGIECELESIVVRHEDQRTGVGGGLMNLVMSTLRARGATLLTLEVRASNEAAMRLYARHGLSRAGKRTGYYRDPVEDAVLMELKF